MSLYVFTPFHFTLFLKCFTLNVISLAVWILPPLSSGPSARPVRVCRQSDSSFINKALVSPSSLLDSKVFSSPPMFLDPLQTLFSSRNFAAIISNTSSSLPERLDFKTFPPSLSPAFCMLQSSYSPIFSSSMSSLFIHFLVLLYFNDCVISFHRKPFLVYTCGSLEEIMLSYWNSNPREEAPLWLVHDAGERGCLMTLVNLPPSRQPGKLYGLNTCLQ